MTDWNIDNYANRLEASQGYNLDKQRQSVSFIPFVKETFRNYKIRLEKATEELSNINMQAHVYGKKMWYTHKTPSQCWICEQNNITQYAVELVGQLADLNPEILEYTFETTKFGLRLTKPTIE